MPGGARVRQRLPGDGFLDALLCMGDDIMHTARLIPRCFFVFLMVISVILPASAREKTDVVILKNGDHITCQIMRLARGMLTVKTDSMGTVDIKWPDVERITSKFLYTVKGTQGQLYVGTLQPAADGHVDVEGPQPASNLEHLSVVEIEELGASRWRRFSGSVSTGSSFTKSSDRRQFDFAGDVTYRTERYSGQFKYNSTVGTSNGETDANRQLVSMTGARYFPGRWLVFSEIGYEHNLELQLDRRRTVLAGPGYRIVRSNRAQLTALAAVAFTRESYYGQEAGKNFEGFYGINAQFFKLYSPKVDITSQFVYLPNYTTWGRRRVQFDSSLRVEVLRDFFVNFTFYDSYDSQPPTSTATKNDYGFTTGISWTFRR
jgi:hypothetical protein